MRRVCFVSSMFTLCAIGLFGPGIAFAQVPLTRATVQAVRNKVSLIAKNQTPRTARIADTMSPGDALATAMASLAELRFNDGSLARVGEQAVFRFVPKTRTFHLSNGTLLMLIPPGRGQTRVRTPNATAGIKGSSFWLRVFDQSGQELNPDAVNEEGFEGADAQKYVTVMGVLGTDPSRPMEISLTDTSEKIVLREGQMAIVAGNRIEVVRYDVLEFLNSADIVKGLNLTQPPASNESDPAMSEIRQEIAATLDKVAPLDSDKPIYENLAALKLPGNRAPNETSSALPRLNSQTFNRLTPFSAANDLLIGPALSSSNPVLVNSVFLGGTVEGSANFPGGGATGGNFPGGGATGGNFPGKGATGGIFPGKGATGGNFPGGGN